MEVGTLVIAAQDHLAGHEGGWWALLPLFWFVVIFGVIFVLRRGCRRRYHSGRAGESALGERFARGEIDEREYRERLDVLRNVTTS